MLFLIGWLKGCCFILYWFFPSSTPLTFTFSFFFVSTPRHSRSALVLRTLASQTSHLRGQENTRFLFFQQWNVLKGFWFQVEAYVYIYIYVWIYIGSREMIFEIFSLRSCCLMKWRLFQLVSLQNEAYQSAVGSCPYFLLDFLVTPIFVAKAKSEGGKASILHLIYWHVGVGMVWRMHEITFTLEIPTVPTTVAFKKRSSSPKDFMSTLD